MDRWVFFSLMADVWSNETERDAKKYFSRIAINGEIKFVSKRGLKIVKIYRYRVFDSITFKYMNVNRYCTMCQVVVSFYGIEFVRASPPSTISDAR